MSEFRKLLYPVKEDGREIREITMRRPVVNDFLMSEQKNIQGAMAKDVDMISRLTGLLPTTVGALDMADFAWCQKTMLSFFGDAGATGSTPL